MGIHIDLDDFGKGFSSMDYLRNLPVDIVKIDRSFITNIVENPRDQSIVRTMVAITSELGMPNIVEGVENLEQIKLLSQMSINRFQGYYFSKPLTSNDYYKYYRKAQSIQA